VAFSLPANVTLKALLEQKHPAVDAHTKGWEVSLDAYDGEGGFLDGKYLNQFQRENADDILRRRDQARYHNYCQTLVDYYVRKVFSKVTRDTTNELLKAWWENIDGAGTDATTFMRSCLAKALAAGHIGILADKTQSVPTGPSVADERAEVFVTRYLPQAILDWRLAKDAKITAVKLHEDVESDDLLAGGSEERLLLWDVDEWVRVTEAEGDDQQIEVERQTHNLGLVPFVVLRPFPSARWTLIGKALVEPSVLKALYNRGSEQDVVLRDQAFSVMVVQMNDPEGDVEEAKRLLGNEIGPTRALFVKGTATYETPSMEVPAVLEASQNYLVASLYRMAHVPFDVGSKESQTAEAIRLQHEALQAVLLNVAAECQRVELELAKLYFAWTSATPEMAQQAFESADVQITYPETFFEADPQVELEMLSAAMNAVPAPTFEKEIQKRIVAMAAPSLDGSTLDAIHAEIDGGQAEKTDPVEAMALRGGAEARLQDAMAEENEVAA